MSVDKKSNDKKLAVSDFLPPPWILSLIGLAALIWLLVALKEIVVLLVVGYAVAFIIMPFVALLEKRGLSRGAAIVTIYGAIVVSIALICVIALPTLIEEYTLLALNLPEYVALVVQRVKDLRLEFAARLPASMSGRLNDISVESILPMLTGDTLRKILSGVFTALLQGYSVTLTIVNLTLLPFIAFYVASDWEKLHKTALSLFPKHIRWEIYKLATECKGLVSAFVKGQLTVASILFALYFLGFSIIGVKLWFLLAVISGFGNLVPYVGTVVGIFLGTIMALVTFGDFTHVLLIWGVFGVVQFLEGFVITPRVVGDSVGLSPLMVIISLFAGGSLFGLLGIFLAIPGAAVLGVFWRHFHSLVLDKLEVPGA